jgi:DNA-binding NtrC family response regulator
MAEPYRILIVDDDHSIAQFLNTVLTAEGYPCEMADNPEDAEALLRRNTFHLALIDIYLGTHSGLDFVRRVRAIQPECECVMMTAQTSIETVARSVTEGAIEYLGKPLLIDELLTLVRRLENRRNTPPAAPPPTTVEPESAIIGRSPKMLEVYRTIARVAPSDATILIAGASGTGKELVARAIHDHSPRAGKPFTPVNCGSLSETLLESELFGYEKGAFTGAAKERQGLFEATNGGTIFLDEVSETSLGFQVNLLRVLQEKQIRRLGTNIQVPVDVRVVAATNRNLNELIADGKFREDLYYRLSVVTIHLPSLSERREDIPLLVSHFLDSFNQRNKRRVTIDSDAVSILAAMPWPGNVRELQNVIERLAIFSSADRIRADDVEQQRSPAAETPTAVEAMPTDALSLRDLERDHILKVLQEAQGNKSLAARRLGIERKTLYKKARRLGIDLGQENQ